MFFDRYLPDSISTTTIRCNDDSSPCIQLTTLYFGASNSTENACWGLYGDFVIWFEVTCKAGFACNDTTASVVLHLNTGDGCPISEWVQFSQTSLSGKNGISLNS